MNVATRNISDTATHATSPGPGSLLKDARKSAGLSLHDVAAKLHLDERVVNALEEDDFTALPAATFVRGYLHSYTLLLGLPSGPVLEALNNEHLSPPTLIPDIAETPQARSDDMPVRLVSYGVVAALTIMVVLWWHNQDFDYREILQPAGEFGPGNTGPGMESPPDAVQITQAPTQEPPPTVTQMAATDAAPQAAAGDGVITTNEIQNADTPPADVAPEAAPASDNELSPERAADPQPQVVEALEQQLAQAQDSIEASREVLAQSLAHTPQAASPEPGEVTTETSQGTAMQPPVAPIATTTESSSTAQTLTPIAGEDTLSMHFTQESWVTVYDNNETRLFYDLTHPDQTLELQGPGPLRVLLGRPQGVTVLYNGKPMKLSPHINSSGIARFTGNP